MAKVIHEVVFYTYPKLIFTWPLIAIGILFYPIAAYGGEQQEAVSMALGWIWTVTLITVLLTMGVDVNRNVAAFWILLIVAVWLGAVYLRDVQGMDFVQAVGNFLHNISPRYERNLGLAVSILLAIPYSIMYVWVRINHKWRVTHNEFEHYSFGRVDRSLARGAKTVRASYPDLFELLLCMAGELVVMDANGQRVLERIEHVPLLPWVNRRLRKILEVTAVTPAVAEEAEAASQEEQ
jgi:hypothetical protein